MTRGATQSPHRLLEVARHARDDEARWDCITHLHGAPSREVWEGAVRLCGSRDPSDRRLGADVLGQLGTPRMPFRDESIAVLRPMLGDPDPAVVRCAAVALGHLSAREALDDLIALGAHRDPEVRHAVAFALMSHDEPRAVAALVALSRDPEPMVRDWATFSLGSLHDADTDEIRHALASRLEDADRDTRIEALVGLATRRDPRVVGELERVLRGKDPPHVVVDAARVLASPDLLPALLFLRESGWPKSEADTHLLDRAIAACRPALSR